MTQKFFNILYLLILSFGILSCATEHSQTIFDAGEPGLILELRNGYQKPLFNHGGNQLLITKLNDQGLAIFRHDENRYTGLTSKPIQEGSYGFMPGDSLVFYITNSFDSKIRLADLVVQSPINGKKTYVEKNSRGIQFLNTVDDKIIYQSEGNLYTFDCRTMEKVENGKDGFAVFQNHDLQLMVLEDGKISPFLPNDSDQYLWPSLSPDGSKVVYYKIRSGTYVYDLQNKTTNSLGDIRAPSWSPDSKWVIGMLDEDNGEEYVKSDIIICSFDGKKRQVITQHMDFIALFPIFSRDQEFIVFNNEVGKLYSISLK